MKQIVLAITGASGAIYARRLAQELVRSGAHVHLIISPHGRRVLADELGLQRFSPRAILAEETPQVTAYSYRDIGALPASGSFCTDGMVVCPCSSNTLAAIAAGLADNLITRAAQVTLKETRRLVVVPRETPLSRIELTNMLRISEAGGIVCPASPGFHLLPRSIDELVDFVVGRVLDLLGLPHTLRTRWQPDRAATPESENVEPE